MSGLLSLWRDTHILWKPDAGFGCSPVMHAWEVFDRWLEDPRVEFYPEPRGLDVAFRAATAPLAARSASKWVGDCYLLAFAKESNATLVTFDRALLQVPREYDYRAIVPA